MTDKTKRIAELEALTADIRAQGWMVPEEFDWEKAALRGSSVLIMDSLGLKFDGEVGDHLGKTCVTCYGSLIYLDGIKLVRPWPRGASKVETAALRELHTLKQEAQP